MTRLTGYWLCCGTLLGGTGLQAADSDRIEVGIYHAERFDRDEGLGVSDNDTTLFAYGRTPTHALVPTDCKKQKNCLSFDIDGSLEAGLGDQTDSSIWANISLYYPVWGDEEIRRNKHDGTYDPDYLPPMTFGLSGGFQHVIEGEDEPVALDDHTDWRINPFFRFHHWFDGAIDKEGFFDVTADVGVDSIYSDDVLNDRLDSYIALETRFKPDNMPKLELAGRAFYVNSDFDDSTIDDEKLLGFEARARYNFMSFNGNGNKVGLYADLAIGHQDIDGGSFDGSFNYVIPSIYFQYPADTYGRPLAASRSYRRGRWY